MDIKKAALRATRLAIKAIMVTLLLGLVYAIVMFWMTGSIYWLGISVWLLLATLFLGLIFEFIDSEIEERLERIEPSEPEKPEKPEKKEGALAVSPADGLNAAGPDCEHVFEPSSKTYTLSNSGKTLINYAIAKSADWLTISNVGGTLAAHGSASVEVSLTDEVKSLSEGVYSDSVKFTNTTNNKGSTSRPVELTVEGEEQCWQVFLTGLEIDDLTQPDEKQAGLRMAIRFDYTLAGTFRIRKENGIWTYKTGTITRAEVGLSNLHEPPQAWITKPLKCVKCDRVTNKKGTPLEGSIISGDLHLNWGVASPEAHAFYSLSAAHFPDPKYDKYRKATGSPNVYVSDHFFSHIRNYPIPLKDGSFEHEWKPRVKFTANLVREK